MAKKTKSAPVSVVKNISVSNANVGRASEGKGQVLSRNSKGVLSGTQGPNYNAVSNNTMKSDRKIASGTGNGSFSGGPAPRVGGTSTRGAGVTVNYGNSSAINKNKIGKLKK